MMKFRNKAQNASQNQFAFAPRLSRMSRNAAGGFSYKVSDWDQLDRFLILGLTDGTYYLDKNAVIDVNVDAINRCIDEDANRVIDRVLEITRENRAMSKDPSLYVLSIVASRKERVAQARKVGPAVLVEQSSEAALRALDVVPQVANTFTDLSHFLAYLRNPKQRGMGNGVMRRLARWYNDMPVGRLALQLVKYQNRDGFSQRDAYDLLHPARWSKPDAVRRALFDFIVDGRLPSEDVADQKALRHLHGFAQLRGEGASAADAARLIKDSGLPIEAVPNELKNAEVYEAVLQGVLAGEGGNTLTWLVRNLGNLSKNGLLSYSRPDIVNAVCAKLKDEDALKAARIHPVLILKALLTYKQGRGQLGSGTWEVVPRVVDALDEAFYKSFRYVEASNKRIMLGIDVSGSMWGQQVKDFGGLTAHQAAAVMALVVAHAEPNWSAVKFDTKATPINISPRMRMDDVVKHVATKQGGGTDLASTIAYARANRIPVDAFVLFTDNETWAGNNHTHEELALYRAEMKIPAKVVCVSLTPNSASVAPPGDDGFLQVVGFDANVPKLVQQFLTV